jgi:hypothetical protein
MWRFIREEWLLVKIKVSIRLFLSLYVYQHVFVQWLTLVFLLVVRRILTCSAIYTVQTVLHINNLKLCRLSEFKMHDWDTSFGSFFGNECRTGRTVFKALYVSIFLVVILLKIYILIVLYYFLEIKNFAS